MDYLSKALMVSVTRTNYFLVLLGYGLTTGGKKMYKVIKQYLIEPLARLLYGDYEAVYEAEEKRLMEQYVMIRRIDDHLKPNQGSIDEICWNELGKEAG